MHSDLDAGEVPRVLGLLSGAHAVARGTTPTLMEGPAAEPGAVEIFAAPFSPAHRILVRTGTQPPVHCARAPDGSFVIVDGEIHNLDTLGAGGGNDAECLLSLYRREGAALFARLDAAAGITLHDAAARVLYVLRDAVGSVPLFFTEAAGELRWSSGIAGLIATGVDSAIDPAALDFYLTSGYLPAPWSMARAIRKLPPGHMLVARAGQAPRMEVYSLPTSRPPLTLRAEEIQAALATLLPRAVQRRCRGTGTGLLLSGGVDSMTLAALMARAAAAPVQAFTFRYLDYDGACNEQAPARSCAALLGLQHQVIEFGPADIMDRLESMLAAYGEPFSYGLHSFKLSDARERGITGLVCGTGADGWFPGRRDEFSRHVLGALEPLRPLLRVLARACAPLDGLGSRWRRLPRGWVGHKRNALSGAVWTACTGLPYNPGDYITDLPVRRSLYVDEDILHQGVAGRRELLGAALADYAGEDAFHRFRFLSLRFYGAEMMQNWNHWSGRAHGVSIRTPYYDRELLAFIHRLPRLSVGKKELRRYAATLLPDVMAYGPKFPQSVPLDHWLRKAPLREFVADTLCEARLRHSGLFRPEAVARLLAAHQSGRENHAWTLWALLTVTLWQQLAATWSRANFFRREPRGTSVPDASPRSPTRLTMP